MEFSSILNSTQETNVEMNGNGICMNNSSLALEELMPPPPPPSSPELPATLSPNHEARDNYEDPENSAKVSGWFSAIGAMKTTTSCARSRSSTITHADTPTQFNTIASETILANDDISGDSSSPAKINPTWTRYTNNDLNINVPDKSYSDTLAVETYLANTITEETSYSLSLSPAIQPTYTIWSCSNCYQTKKLPVPQPTKYTPRCNECGGRIFNKLVVQDTKRRPIFLAR